MSTNYDIAFDFLYKHEGELSEDPHDPGGVTKYGISYRFAVSTGDLNLFDTDNDGKISEEDIKALSIDKAKEAFKKYWWEYNHYDKIENIKVAAKVFDIAVNIGKHRANMMLQQSINFASNGHVIHEDGIIGPYTLSAINALDDNQIATALKFFTQRVADHYNYLVVKNDTLSVFLKGWLKRAYDNLH